MVLGEVTTGSVAFCVMTVLGSTSLLLAAGLGGAVVLIGPALFEEADDEQKGIVAPSAFTICPQFWLTAQHTLPQRVRPSAHAAAAIGGCVRVSGDIAGDALVVLAPRMLPFADMLALLLLEPLLLLS